MNPQFVHLRMHSEYSVTDSTVRLDSAIKKVKEQGVGALGLTDLNNIFGGLIFYTHARKAGVKALMGCDLVIQNEADREKPFRMAVICQNHDGYKNLCEILTHAWLKNQYMGRGETKMEWLFKHHEGLIFLSGGPEGQIAQLCLAGKKDEAIALAKKMKEAWRDRFFLELQRAGRPSDEAVVRYHLSIADDCDIPVVATHPIQFLEPQDFDAHDIRVCIARGEVLADKSRPKLYSPDQYFKSPEEMISLFADVPSAIANTVEIAKRCNLEGVLSKPQLPLFPTPDGMSLDDYIDQLSHEGLEQRLKFLYPDKEQREKERPRYEERLQFELGIIKKMGFPGYFLIVQDFIRAAREELGVSVGPGRGSAAGSAVAYCLVITRIDPIKYDLLFERFLNPDRISLPDIDVDFDDDGRGRVLNWVTEKYGQEKVAHIITYGTMATKLAIKDVARVQKLPLSESDRLCKLVPDKIPDKKMNLTNAIAYVPELQAAEVSPDPILRDTIKYAKMLEGNVRNTGVHACGTIICRDDITDWVPVSTADDKETGEKMLVTQYEGSVIEDTGLIKMDFLGLKTLSIIKEAIENIKHSKGIILDIDEVDISDPPTYALYSEGRTIGTFQFESAGMQKYLRELEPSTFEDLIAMNALYRPGPMDYIPDFIDRKHGRKPIEYDIPIMEKYLKDTYGITVYQEQVMLLSRLLADFTRGESDALRKAMGKKLRDKLDHMKPKFIEGGRKNGHDPKVLEKIWTDWEKFASYAFNKSHATCYSWVAYQTAFLKANYPAEYMAATMSRNISNITEITKLMDESKATGIMTKGPDVNESYLKFSVNRKGDIRFGLGAIKGVGESAVQSILEERERNGEYKDIFDFVQRVNLSACNRKNIENLALAGAFDSFTGIKREDFFVKNAKDETFTEVLVRYGNKYQMDKAAAANSLFGGENQVDIATPEIIPSPAWGDLERLNKERDLVGIYLSAHPLDEYAVILENVCNVHMAELADLTPLQNRDLTMGGIVTAVREGYTKTGKPYGIAKVEDYSGSAEFAFFGNEWVEKKNFFMTGMFLFMRGKCQPKQWRQEEWEVKISTIELLPEVKEKIIEKLTVSAPLSALDEELITEFSALIKAHPGNAELYFHVMDEDGQMYVNLMSRTMKISVQKEIMTYLKSQPQLSYKIN